MNNKNEPSIFFFFLLVILACWGILLSFDKATEIKDLAKPIQESKND